MLNFREPIQNLTSYYAFLFLKPECKKYLVVLFKRYIIVQTNFKNFTRIFFLEYRNTLPPSKVDYIY